MAELASPATMKIPVRAALRGRPGPASQELGAVVPLAAPVQHPRNSERSYRWLPQSSIPGTRSGRTAGRPPGPASQELFLRR
jgi:hypothetical protein